MASGDRPLALFITLLVVFSVLNFFVPYLNEIFSSNSITQNPSLLNELSGADSSSSIGLLIFIFRLLLIPFWTFGLPLIMNTILLIPRIVMIITGYYVIFPTK